MARDYNFAVVRTTFHGGGVVSRHVAFDYALKAARADRVSDCACGCADVFPLNDNARSEMIHFGYFNQDDYVVLFDDLPFYDPSLGPYVFCR